MIRIHQEVYLCSWCEMMIGTYQEIVSFGSELEAVEVMQAGSAPFDVAYCVNLPDVYQNPKLS